MRACTRLIQQLHPGTHVVTVVVIGPATDQVAIHHAGLVDKGAATNLEIKLTLWHCRHAAPFDTSGIGRDFHAMTHTGNRLVGFKEMTCHAHQVLVVANIFGRAPSTEENT